MSRKPFDIAALSIFFISGVYIDIGFALKPFIIAGVLAALRLIVYNKSTLELRSYDYIFLCLILYGALSGAAVNPQLPLLRIVAGTTLYFICYLSLSSFLCSRYKSSPEVFERDILTTGVVVILLSLGLYAFTLVTTPRAILTDVEYQNVLYGLEYDRGLARLKGLTHDPNVASLTAIFFISASVFLRSGDYKWRIVLAVLSITMLFMTLSRAGILAAVILLAFYLVVSKKDFAFIMSRYGLWLVATLIAIGVFIGSQFGTDLMDIASQRQRNFFSGSGRLALWADALKAGQQCPLFGVGWFEYVSENRFVHNTYLEIIVELGAIGFVLYVSVLALIESELRSLGKWDNGSAFIYCYFFGFLICAFFLSIFLHETFFLIMILIKIYHAQRRHAYDCHFDLK